MISRRNAITGIVGVVAGGSIITALGSDRASAAVTFGDLTIKDRTVEQTSEIQDVQIHVNGNYKFEADETPDAWSLQLHVGQNGEYTQVDEERLAPSSSASSGTEEVSGSIIDTPHFAIDNFRVGSSQTVQEIDVKLVFEVEMNGEAIATAEVTETATLTVTPGSVDATVQVKGTGEIQISR